MRRAELSAGSRYDACFGRQCRPECDHTLVYFIQEARMGPIKIGHGEHPERRLVGCQNGNPRPLRLIAWMRGGRRLEGELHRRFASTVIRGEWFRATDELVVFIKNHAVAYRRGSAGEVPNA